MGGIPGWDTHGPGRLEWSLSAQTYGPERLEWAISPQTHGPERLEWAPFLPNPWSWEARMGTLTTVLTVLRG